MSVGPVRSNNEAGVGERQGMSRRQILQRGAGMTGALVSMGGLSGFLAACGSSGSSTSGSGSIAPGGVLKAALTAEPDTLDPAKSGYSVSYELFSNINSGLVEMSPEGEIVPAVAKSWKEVDDRTYTFDLREGVTFHNGDKLTADDVKYSIDRILDPATASPWAANLSSIEGVEVDSPTKVTLHLSAPYAPLLTILSRNTQILSKRAIETGNPDRKPVGCGPFEFVEWSAGDHILLRKNKSYFQSGRPHLDQVRVSWTPTDPSAVEAVRAGELNYLSTIATNLISSVETDPAFNFTTSDKAGKPWMLGFNVKDPVVNNKALRQAIAWALDREAVNKVSFFGAGEVGSEEVGKGSAYYGADPYSKGPDLDLAKKLIADSGLPTPIKLEYIATSEVKEFGSMGEVMRDQLKSIGIDLEVQVLEGSVWLNKVLAKDYQITGCFNETVSDPDQMYSLMALTGAELNIFNYSNKQCDAAIEAAREESNVPKRKALYENVREFIYDEVPFIYMYYQNPTLLASNNVIGVTAPPTLELAWDKIGFEKT